MRKQSKNDEIMTTEITNYWTFFCSPKKWEIDKFLSTNVEYDLYRVNDWYKNDVKPGQLAVIKVGLDKRNKTELQGRKKLNAGIYAVVEILDIPKLSKEVSEFYIDSEEQGKEKFRVKIRYLKNLLDKPLLLETLKDSEIINQDKYLIEGFQRSNMPLKKEAFKEIINLIDGGEEIFSNIEPEKTEDYEQIKKLELKYQNASPEVKYKISKTIERGAISKEFKKINNYKCQVCDALGKNQHSFYKKNGNPYVEVHHIMPVSNLTEGSLGIVNLITVCANHHRELHYGNVEIIENTSSLLILSINEEIIQIEKKSFASA